MDFLINGIQNLMQIEAFSMLFKLLLIVVLAGIVGYEREAYKKPAGFRTYVLVGISAVLVMCCGNYLFYEFGADPTRIPAQLLSGIGFLGAGTILRDGFNVKGLTTAAGLLAVTCIGLVVGSGYYMSAIIATFVVYCILSYSHKISDRLEHFNFIKLEIKSSKPKAIMEKVKNVFDENNLEIVKMKIIDEDDDVPNYIRVDLKGVGRIDVNTVISKIMAFDNVSVVNEISDND